MNFATLCRKVGPRVPKLEIGLNNLKFLYGIVRYKTDKKYASTFEEWK